MTKNNYNLKDLSNEESEKQNKKTIDLSNSEIEETSNSNNIIECFEQNIENETNNDENDTIESKNEENKLKLLLEEKDNKLLKVSQILKEKLFKIEELLIEKKNYDEQFNRLKNIEIPKLVKDNEEALEKLSLSIIENSSLRERLGEIHNERNCECACNCNDCICNKNYKDKCSSEKKTSEDLISDHDNLVPSCIGINDKDPFKILLDIITIFDEVKIY